jgi:hypothetical protein
MLYDISPQDFAHHVRHATTWNELGVRCGLEKNEFGKVRITDKLSMLQEKVHNMRLNVDHFMKPRYTGNDEVKFSNKVETIDEETFKMLVKNNTTWMSLAVACGYKSRRGIKYLVNRTEMLELDTNHLSHSTQMFDNDKFFCVDSKYTFKNELKKRLTRDFDRVYECNQCKNFHFVEKDGVLTWMNKPVVLQLDHINGINNDNRVENLRFLCALCHAQTSTFCGKNNKRHKIVKSWLEEGKTCHAPGSIASILN